MRSCDVNAVATLAAAVLGGIAMLTVGGCGSGSVTAAPRTYPPMPTPAPTSVASPVPQGIIRHVVIIVQENRSFNNLFHGFPGAYTVDSGMTHTGQVVPLKSAPLAEKYDVSHSHDVWVKAYDQGHMDGFDLEGSSGGTLAPYSYVQQSDVQQYWTLAQQYALADQTYQSNTGPSFPAHQYLIAGQSEDADENPQGSPDVWGCDSPPATRVKVLDPDGKERQGPFPCFDYPTLADSLDAHGLSWAQYAQSVMNFFNGYDAIDHIRYGPDWPSHIVSPSAQVITDIQHGVLADVTWVMPAFTDSDHPGDNSATGPAWVSSIVDAVGNSAFWNDSAIFIIWDDWGGMYDPMPPPVLDQMGLGFRVPLIVVSPYARHGYVSHFRHESASIIHFTEDAFGLPTLGAADARADDLADCFDFTQQPAPFSQVLPALSRTQQRALRTAPPELDY